MSRAIRRAFALTMALTTACSLTAFPDLTSGNGAARSGEGADALASADGGGDGDSATAPDQSSTPIDAATTGFCRNLTPAPFLCDDFDDSATLESRWGIVHPFDGKYGISFATTSPRSLPRSIVSRIDPGSVDCAYATLEKQQSGLFTRAEVGFSGRLARSSDLTGSPDVLAMVSFGSGNSRCQLYLSATPTSLTAGEQIIHPTGPREENVHEISGALPVGAWARFVIGYDTTAKRLTVTKEGTTILDVSATLTCPYSPGTAIGTVGLFCGAQRATSRVYEYDDVTFNARGP